jgi:hypothetical protein
VINDALNTQGKEALVWVELTQHHQNLKH